MFETPVAEPRPYTIIVKSFRGSRDSLMGAAIALMDQNPRFGERAGGAYPMFLRATSTEPAFAAQGVTFRGVASIKEILSLMRAVEERLTPVPDVDPTHPTIALELWWVGGVRDRGLGLELPNPIILEHDWANELFVVSSEPALAGSFGRGNESRIWAVRVAAMFEGIQKERSRDRRVQDIQGDIYRPMVEEEHDKLVFYARARDHAEIVAGGAELVFVLDAHLHNLKSDPKLGKERANSQLDSAADVVERRPLSWVEPMEVPVPNESVSVIERYRVWMKAVRERVAQRSFAVGSVVIFDVEGPLMRGALLGERVPATALISPSGLEGKVYLESATHPIVPAEVLVQCAVPLDSSAGGTAISP